MATACERRAQAGSAVPNAAAFPQSTPQHALPRLSLRSCSSVSSPASSRRGMPHSSLSASCASVALPCAACSAASSGGAARRGAAAEALTRSRASVAGISSWVKACVWERGRRGRCVGRKPAGGLQHAHAALCMRHARSAALHSSPAPPACPGGPAAASAARRTPGTAGRRGRCPSRRRGRGEARGPAWEEGEGGCLLPGAAAPPSCQAPQASPGWRCACGAAAGLARLCSRLHSRSRTLNRGHMAACSFLRLRCAAPSGVSSGGGHSSAPAALGSSRWPPSHAPSCASSGRASSAPWHTTWEAAASRAHTRASTVAPLPGTSRAQLAAAGGREGAGRQGGEAELVAQRNASTPKRCGPAAGYRPPVPDSSRKKACCRSQHTAMPCSRCRRSPAPAAAGGTAAPPIAAAPLVAAPLGRPGCGCGCLDMPAVAAAAAASSASVTECSATAKRGWAAQREKNSSSSLGVERRRSSFTLRARVGRGRESEGRRQPAGRRQSSAAGLQMSIAGLRAQLLGAHLTTACVHCSCAAGAMVTSLPAPLLGVSGCPAPACATCR